MADIKYHVQILSKVPLFTGLNEKQLTAIAKRLTARTYIDGEAIIVQGKGGEGLFIISEGSAKAVRIQPDGDQFTVNQFSDGDFFGELAILDDGVRTASVIATSPTKCLILTRWDFKGILKQDPEMAILLLEEMAKRFRRALETL